MLSDEDLDRYSRQIIIKGVGEQGQEKLMASTIAMVGVGGIAAHLLPALVAAGVQKIILIDDDMVANSNLSRQIMFRQEDIGQKKIIAAARTLQSIAPTAHIITHDKKITSSSDQSLLSTADIILEGSDNLSTKLLVDQLACLLQKPIIIGGATGQSGQVAFFHYQPINHHSNSPRYKDIVGEQEVTDAGHCATVGVLNSTLMQVAGLMAQLLFDYIFYNQGRNQFMIIEQGRTIVMTDKKW